MTPATPATPTYSTHVLHVPGADPERDAIVGILTETFPDLCVHRDPHRKGVMWNWLGALRCFVRSGSTADWLLVLQDDALPLTGTLDHLPLALAGSPQDILGLTHFGGYGEVLLRRGYAYGEGAMVIWGGASAMRASIVPLLLRESLVFHNVTGYPHDDGAVSLFQAKRGAKTAMTSRALFDQPIKASLLGHNTPVRRPTCTLTTHPDGPPWEPNLTGRVSRGSMKDFAQRLSSWEEVTAS